MWIEAILTKDDFDRLLAQLMPLTIDLGEGGDHVALSEPREVQFVEGQGVRLQCEAKVRYSVLGIHVPLTIHKVTAMLRPVVQKGPSGDDQLAFKIFIVHADVAGLPTMVDEKLTDTVNAALEKHLALSWDFAAMLSRSVELPASMHPLETLSLDVAWGKVKVTAETIVMAISFHSSIARHDGTDVAEVPRSQGNGPAPMVLPPQEEASHDGVSRSNLLVLGGSSVALLAAGAFGAYRMAGRDRWGMYRPSVAASVATVAAGALFLNLGARVVAELARGVRRGRELADEPG